LPASDSSMTEAALIAIRSSRIGMDRTAAAYRATLPFPARFPPGPPAIRHRASHRPHQEQRTSRSLLSQGPSRRSRKRHSLRRRPQLPTHPLLAQQALALNLTRSIGLPPWPTSPQSGLLTVDCATRTPKHSDGRREVQTSSSSNAFASLRSGVSKPSVN